MSHTENTLSVVLPCFNEENSVQPVLELLCSERDRLISSGLFTQVEIVVIDDGSTDNSLNKLKEFSSSISISSFAENQGYGTALKRGFSQSSGQWICFFDLDRTCSPKDIAPIFQQMTKEGSQMGLGNRLSDQSHMPTLRYIGNRIYRDLTTFLLQKSVTDCCTGFRIFHRKYLPLFIEPLPDQLNYSLAMTIAFLRSGGKLTETKISYGDREGRSKLNAFIDGPRFLVTLLRYSISPRFSHKKLQSFLT